MFNQTKDAGNKLIREMLLGRDGKTQVLKEKFEVFLGFMF